jgi:hypothetical protein
MSVEPVITQAECIRQWLSVLLGPLVTSIGFFFIYKQLAIAAKQAKISANQAETASNNYLLAVDSANRATAQAGEQQNWKKAEFLANQVKDFYADEIIDRVTHIVDWSTCKIRFDEKAEHVLCVHDNVEYGKARNEQSLRTEFFDKNLVVIISQALRSTYGPNHHFTELEVAVRDDFDWFFFRLGQFQHMLVSGLFSYEEVEIHLSYVLDLFSGGGARDVSPDLTKNIDAYMQEYSLVAARSLIDHRIRKRLATFSPSPAAALPAAAAPP